MTKLNWIHSLKSQNQKVCYNSTHQFTESIESGTVILHDISNNESLLFWGLIPLASMLEIASCAENQF